MQSRSPKWACPSPPGYIRFRHLGLDSTRRRPSSCDSPRRRDAVSCKPARLSSPRCLRLADPLKQAPGVKPKLPPPHHYGRVVGAVVTQRIRQLPIRTASPPSAQ
eukprot:Skav217547  [mRNA]  locus=scaffold4393:112105:114161:+ [translate_table: standard]